MGRLILLVVLVLLPVHAQASAAADMNLCRSAAIAAADRHKIPREVLLAITLVETRTRRDDVSGPWPWTVNVAGKGYWFDTRAAALVHAQRTRLGGQTSFDVGCFQLNFRWHGQHFASIDEMFEPSTSGDYAARFLRDLYAESGNWMTAAGHYHSRTPKHARRYRGLVAKTVARLGGQPVVPAPETRIADSRVRPRVDRVADARGWPLAQVRVRRPGNGATAGSVELRVFSRGQPLRVVNGASRGGR